jgi:regulator of protease activity HflC (stomatin/prohibitin superfamily)
MSAGFTYFALFVVVLAVVGIFMAVKIIPQGYEYTVERFGRYTRKLSPGLRLIYPIVDRIGYRVVMMETFLDVPSQEVITKDNASVQVDAVVFYQVVDAAKASYEVEDLTSSILALTMTNIRSVLGTMDLEESMSKRDDINSALLEAIEGATNPWGVKITRVEIKDISPPQDLVNAMNRQLKAERDRRAVVTEAEGQRQAEIQKAEGEKLATILVAQGSKEAAFLAAEAREREAEAEAKATELVSRAISQGNTQAINYFIAQKYVEALQTIGSAENQKVLFLPLDSSKLAGTLAGIGEIVQEVFNTNKQEKINYDQKRDYGSLPPARSDDDND